MCCSQGRAQGQMMLAEGVNPALIENVARHAGMPVGPLECIDGTSEATLVCTCFEEGGDQVLVWLQ